MSDTDALALVDAYLGAIAKRDFDAARGYLSDTDFRYVSPIGKYDDADVFISNIERIGPILVKMETRFRSVQGSRVAHFLDVTVSIAEYVTYRSAQLTEVANGRITRMEVIFDASDYQRMFGE
ncbi:MAG: hypothetical protein KDI22_11010 [Gammaproteobacteria bacterium]|nr:hypothetical protein [Gammaproteobacteria bacterium]MCP5430104.1 hypothetical protein [Chromatiaceae bacterium]MCB1819513.1 hypothetical protein [Gammaproteobacteria bacterium]MCP5435503.1 hypothetical protein [Chromatiaceae bacterium]HOP17972.1 hypothetical protein [Gammaproteobacteria bacterium]